MPTASGSSDPRLPLVQHPLHDPDLLALSSNDLVAEILDLRVSNRRVLADKDRAGMVWNHRPEEEFVADADLLPAD